MTPPRFDESSDDGIRTSASSIGYYRGSGAESPSTNPLDSSGSAESAQSFDPSKSYGETRACFEAEFEKRYVLWLLGRHSNNVSAAAREARMDRKHLHDLAKKHGLRQGTPPRSAK